MKFLLILAAAAAASIASIASGDDSCLAGLRSTVPIHPELEVRQSPSLDVCEAPISDELFHQTNEGGEWCAPDHYQLHGTLLDVFKQAWENHEDVTLVPDDVWLTIIFQFTKYVNDRDSALFQGMFVHQNERLSVSYEDVPQLFEKMSSEIKQNTKGELVDVIQANFTTTTPLTRFISIAALMDVLKRHFEYYASGSITCGIRYVHFEGTLGDWELILSKLDALRVYDVDGHWDAYSDGVKTIVQGLIRTFKGDPDLAFWDGVIATQSHSHGCYSVTKLSGWALKFYGLGGVSMQRDYVGDHRMIEIPIVLFDDQRKTNATIRAGFTGILKSKHSYRPRLSLSISTGSTPALGRRGFRSRESDDS